MNIGSELTRVAGEMPNATAVVEPTNSVRDRDRGASITYRSITFQEVNSFPTDSIPTKCGIML